MDLVRGVYGAHGGYGTSEGHDTQRITGGGHGLRGGPGKRVDRVLPGQPQAFRQQRRPVDDCSQNAEERRRTTEQGAERFMVNLITTEKDRARPRHAVVCPNVTRKWPRRGYPKTNGLVLVLSP